MRCNRAAAPKSAGVISAWFLRIRLWIFLAGTESRGASCSDGDGRRTKRGCESESAGSASLGWFGWDTHLERNKRSTIRLRTTRRRDLGRYLQSREMAARVGE